MPIQVVYANLQENKKLSKQMVLKMLYESYKHKSK